jgi:hypothetical protein
MPDCERMSDSKTYVTVFGYQSKLNFPRLAHTFAVFSRKNAGQWEHCTISWMPKRGRVSLFRLPEPGANWSLKKSLEVAKSSRLTIRRWGPYLTTPELFELAQAQKRQLDSGEVKYQALDWPLRGSGGVKNCMHAVTDIVPRKAAARTWFARGFRGSRRALSFLRPWLIDSSGSHPEVLAALDLQKYGIVEG